MGAKSFGKGSVQSVIPLTDGSGLRLTTAKYFTPSGICIHGVGITPDVVVEKVPLAKEVKNGDKDKKDKRDLDEIFEEVENNNKKDVEGLTEEKKKELEQKKKDDEDNQLQAAINIIKGIKVYSGFTNQN